MTPQGYNRIGLVMGDRNKVQMRGRPIVQAAPGAEVLYASNDARPSISKGRMYGADVVTIQGKKFLVSSPSKDGSSLVLVMTGVQGPRDEWFTQLNEHAQKGVSPIAHGSFALDSGSDLVGANEDQLLGKATRVKWNRDQSKVGDGSIRARNWDLWRMQPGSQVIVADIFDPSRVVRLVLDGGGLRSVDGGANARAVFDELENKRRDARSAAIARRREAKEQRAAEAEAGASEV